MIHDRKVTCGSGMNCEMDQFQCKQHFCFVLEALYMRFALNLYFDDFQTGLFQPMIAYIGKFNAFSELITILVHIESE